MRRWDKLQLPYVGQVVWRMDECGINQGFSCIENYEVAAFSAASGCQQNSDRQSRARVTEQRPLGLLVHIFFLVQIF